jgi:Sec-independent protein translocase protein TatA
VALLVLGPEKLPTVAYKIGKLIQKIKQYQWDFQRQFQKLEQVQVLKDIHHINNETRDMTHHFNNVLNTSTFDTYSSSYHDELNHYVPSYQPRKLKKNLAIRLSPALLKRIKRQNVVGLKKLRR